MLWSLHLLSLPAKDRLLLPPPQVWPPETLEMARLTHALPRHGAPCPHRVLTAVCPVLGPWQGQRSLWQS